MRKHLMAGALAVATMLLAGAPVLAQPGQSCFFVSQWNGWKAPDDHTVYLRVNGNQIYRLDIAHSCSDLRFPGARLITRNQEGTGSICTPLDWDLRVAEGNSIPTPCIVKSMTLLTPDQAAALPRDSRP
jgi:hypothetical protein